MGPSPDGDRRRPLHLAVRSTRSLGALFLLLGGCASIPLIVGLGGAAAAPPPKAQIPRIVASLLFYLAPGVIYLLCSIFLARRRIWALITTMTVAGLQIALMAFGMAMLLYGMVAQRGPSLPLLLWIPLLIMFVLILALARLEYHLVRSLQAIRQQQVEDQRGFEPLSAAPGVPGEGGITRTPSPDTTTRSRPAEGS